MFVGRLKRAVSALIVLLTVLVMDACGGGTAPVPAAGATPPAATLLATAAALTPPGPSAAATALTLTPPGPTLPATETPTFVPTPRRTATPTATRMATSIARPTVLDQMLTRCPAAQEVIAIDQDLKLSFQTDPTAGKLVCTASAGSADLTLMQRRVYNVLLIMKQLQFGKPLPWTNKGLYTWLVGAIKGIRFRGDIGNSYCCDPKDTIDVGIHPNSVLIETDQWVWTATGHDPLQAGGLFEVLINFVHEARHNEGFLHDCPLLVNGTPFPNANDKTIAQLGAWGVQYYLQVWIASYGDADLFPEVYRKNSQNQADDIRRTRICNPS